MHSVELIDTGRLLGWVSGDIGGFPAQVQLCCAEGTVAIAAVHERVDVLSAGFTRFSGFDLHISAHAADCPWRVHLEESEYEVAPLPRCNEEVVTVEEAYDDLLSGSIAFDRRIRSLCFYSAEGSTRAEINPFPDHIPGPGGSTGHRYRFRVENFDVSKIFAVKINNDAVHCLGPGWLAALL
jgi:hypothetical protein